MELKKLLQASLILTAVFTAFMMMAPAFAAAEIHREVSINMQSFSRIEYTRVKVYTDDDIGMFRAIIDRDFGNNDGLLTAGEAEAMRKWVEDYPMDSSNFAADSTYNVTKLIAFEEQGLLIFSSAYTAENITNPNATEITTIHQELIKAYEPGEKSEYDFYISSDMWTYTDFLGNESATSTNKITFTAPIGYVIDTEEQVPGILNASFSSDNRTVTGNGFSMGNVIIPIMDESFIVHPDTPDDGGGGISIETASFVAGAILLGIVVIIYFTQQSVPPPGKYSKLGDEELAQREKKAKKAIIDIRAQLRDEEITKAEAKEKEAGLKQEWKALKKELERREKIKDSE